MERTAEVIKKQGILRFAVKSNDVFFFFVSGSNSLFINEQARTVCDDFLRSWYGPVQQGKSNMIQRWAQQAISAKCIQIIAFLLIAFLVLEPCFGLGFSLLCVL